MKTIKKVRNYFFKITHPGNKVYCVYCGKSFGKFLHEGVKSPIFKKYKFSIGGYALNVKCPNCNSVDRSRLLNLYFTLRTDVFKKPTRMLHISPNYELARFLSANENIDYVCGALNPEEFTEFNGLKMDATDIQFEDNEFDVVVCNHILEHIIDDVKAMKELYRVLKPGGFAILQVPIAMDLEKSHEDYSITTPKQRKLIYGQFDHVRLYGIDYFDRLAGVGFRVERDHPRKNQWADDLEKHRLRDSEEVIVCYKD